MRPTAIVCCRPMDGRDIFLARAGGRSLFAATAGRLLAQGAVDRVVLAVAGDVPDSVVGGLRADGFEVLLGGREAPQRRILEAMERLGLSEAVVLNGYSFLVDAEILGRLAERRAAGDDLAAYVSKTPFRYACLLDLEACREIAAAGQPPLPPNRLHCFRRLPGSRLRVSLVRPQEEFAPLDDCFWLLALNALHGGGDGLLAGMLRRLDSGTSAARALHETLCAHGLDIPALAGRYDAKSVHLYFKNRREVEYTWLERMDGVRDAGGTFLEVGSGESPYLSRLFARHFARGLCFDPFAPQDSPLFRDRLAIARELDEKLAPHLLSRGGAPGRLEYRASDLEGLALPGASMDFCYSRSVLEHVEDLAGMAAELRRVMRPGAVMLHAVDFTAHDERRDGDVFPFYACAKDWWLANKPRLVNLLRLPDVLEHFTAAGFEVRVLGRNVDSRLPAQIHPDWRGYAHEDLVCGGAFLRCTAAR